MKLAIITGGSKGLGLALCEQFLARAYTVLEFSRSAPHPYSVQVDLAIPEQSRLSIARAVEPLDCSQIADLIVISNANTLEPIGLASEKSPSAIMNNLNVNLTSAILVLTELVAKFQPAPCRKVIVNISSGAALEGCFGWSLYCAAKAGMENFVRSLALEQQSQSHPFLPINIDPGLIDTDMQALIRATAPSDFPDLEYFIGFRTKGLLVPPAQVAAAIIHILDRPSLSAGSRYETFDPGGY